MVLVQRLTSPSNVLLKAVRKAVTQGTTTPDGCLVAETFHLLEEALRSKCEISVVLAAESARDRVEQALGGRPGVRLAVLPDALLERISATESSPGVLALVSPPVWRLDDLFRGLPMVVALDGVQDPGNAGGIVRAAEAFGSTGLVFLKGSANPYNPKTIRASAGSVFRVPITAGLGHAGLLAALAKRNLALYAAMPSGGIEASRADFARGCAIVIGGEGRGVREDLWTGATAVRIPTAAVESLNAAMAAGILLYEARRQRGRP
jgi:TrmH family RNA methyltransferase